jgi:NTE family protein
MSRRNSRHKGVNIALQGGGAHGAFTWGVLDRLFEDDRLWIEAISGTSAGAMNAVVAAQGMFEGGAAGARARLASFWRAVSKAARTSPLRRSPLAALTGDWSLKSSPAYVAFDIAARLASPYDVNPLGLNPLRDVVSAEIDFAKVRACRDMGVFVGATNAETGLGRAFAREEITLDTVMASACLPYLFRAVEIDGAPYWDGGYSGNPPLMPFLESSPSDDVMIVQINPIRRDGAPRRAQDIQNRINEISFNAVLIGELRAVNFVRRLIRQGRMERGQMKNVLIHLIANDELMTDLSASTKLLPSPALFQRLKAAGRASAEDFLTAHRDKLNKEASLDLSALFG